MRIDVQYGSSVELTSPVSKGAIMSDSNQAGLTDNVAGALAYITIVPAIVFLVLPPYNTSSFVRFHAWQSVFMNIAAIILVVALSFFTVFSLFFGSFFFLMLIRLIWLAWFIVWLICVLKAVNGERYKLPVLGDLAEKQAGK
jgi:uncharacterized membrane protein